MKYTATAISLLTLLSSSAAQSLSDVPACASEAALSSFTNSGCPLTDAACICRNQGFLDSLLPVVQDQCSPEELQSTFFPSFHLHLRIKTRSERLMRFSIGTIEFTRGFCSDAGVDLAISTSADAASPTATDSAPSPTMAAPSATASNGTMTPGNSTEGGVPTSPDPSPQPAPDSGVAGLVGLAKNAGVLGAVAMAAAMVL
ncbi:MAG: hypothetical protein Q9198_011238 [Flavoplaca austrocitrina]